MTTPDAPSTTGVDRVEVFFDPMCPYAYQTSRWLRDVRAQTGLALTWRFFSLEEINRVEGKKHPWERPWSYGWSQMRIGAVLRRRSMDELDRWYAAVGQAFHLEGRRTHDPDVHRALLDELGMGADTLDEALDDPTTSDEVRADHDEAVGVHAAFGVPTLVLPSGRAQYLQMVPAPPDPDDARALWDLVVAYDRFPTVFEVRHPKRPEDIGLIASTFEPYLRARDWQTIENAAP